MHKYLASRVRVRSAPETASIGAAGRVGTIVGQTRPSSSGEPVVGPAPNDYALAVLFDDGSPSLWFRPDLLEIIGEEEVTVSFDTPPPQPRRATPETWRGHEKDPVHLAINWLLRRLNIFRD